MAASKLAEQTRLKGEHLNNLDLSKGPIETRSRDKLGYQEDNKFDTLKVSKSSLRNGGIYNMNAVHQRSTASLVGNMNSDKYSSNVLNKESNNNTNDSVNSNATDKRFKTLPASETLSRNVVLGGYIFVCNNDMMQDDLKSRLFGSKFWRL